MIKQGIPIRDFLGHYETQYQKVMAQKPARSAWDYEKNMSIISVFNMLLARIKKDGNDENLLSFISCFGPRRVAVSLMGQSHEPVKSSLSSDSDRSDAIHTDEMIWLDRFWNDRLEFQVVTGQLESLCALKRNRDSEGNTISISLHDSITRWRFETLTKDVRERWILAAAYALSRCLPEDTVDQSSQIKFLPLVQHFYNIIRRYIDPQKLEAPAGEFCQQYGKLMTRFAQLYLNSGFTAEGESVFLQAISYRKFVEMSSWPKGRRSLLLLKGFAIILSKNGKMGDAAETTEALHAASMGQLGPGDEITCWAAAQLPAVRHTKHRDANNEHRAIVASRGGKLSLSTPELTSNARLQNIPQRLIRESDKFHRPQSALTRLTLAGFSGDVETIRLELDSGVNIRRDHRPMFPWDLRTGVDYSTDIGSAVLQAASSAGRTVVVDMLLNYGVDVNAISYAPTLGIIWGTALIAASENGCSAVVNTLLKREADVNIKSHTSVSALYLASREGHIAVVETLLNHGADINDNSYSTALHEASAYGHTAVVEMLLRLGADVNLCCGPNGTALHKASQFGYTAVVEVLLKNGADVNLGGETDATALHLASDKGHTTIVELLLKNGADINICGKTIGTPLQSAAREDHQRRVELLLNKGADINAQCGSYGHALYTAAGSGYQSLVELLLKRGADINAEYLTYGTALHVATYTLRESIVRLLIRNGADVNARSDWGTPLQIASYQKLVDLVDLLKAAGARDDD